MVATVEQAAIESATANYESRTRLRGYPRLAGRTVWLALTLLSLSVIVAAIIVRLRSLDRFSAASLPATWTMGAFRAALASLGLSINFYLAFNLFFAYLLIAGFLTTAFVIFLRRSDDWVVLYVSLLFILWPLSILDFSNLLDMIPAFRLPVNFLAVLGTLSLLPFFFIFPNGRVVPRAAPWIIALWAILVLSSSFSPGSILDATTWPALLNFLMQAGFIGAGVVAQIYRYTCVSNAAERQQTKWVVFCGTLMALVLVAYVMIRVIFPAVNQPGVPGLAYVLALPVVSFFFLLLPIGIGLSVLRYRLWDIDLLISRALVYIPLTALLAGLFAASVTFLQKGFIALTGQGSDFSAVLGTLLVVAALTPVKDRLQALVDKRFKEGGEPARRLTAFGDQVRSRVNAVDAHQVSRRFLEEAVLAYGAKSGAAYWENEGESKLIATIGEWNDEAQLSVPLQMPGTGVKLGEIRLGVRSNGAGYSKRDREALQATGEVVTQAIQQDQAQVGARLAPEQRA